MRRRSEREVLQASSCDECVAKERRCGDEQVTAAQAVSGKKVVGPAARLRYQNHACQHVPGVEMHLDVTIEPAVGYVRNGEGC